MADPDHYDLILIGSGTAAQTFFSSLSADWKKKRIALVEEDDVGGTCALRGCQPKKFLVEVADAVARAHMLEGLGVAGRTTFDWEAMQRNKNAFLDGYSEETIEDLEADGVTVLRGRAAFVNESTIEVDGGRYSAEHFIVAAGSRPRRLDAPASDLVVDSSGFLDLPELPDDIIFIGGGYIAMEFAHVAARAGATVRMLVRGDSVLSGFDPDCVEAVVEASQDAGITFLFNSETAGISTTQNGVQVETGDGRTLEAKLVVEAIGRIPNTDRLGAAEGGLELARDGSIEVDEHMRSVSNERVLALGDIAAAGANLATVADNQARVAARFLMGDRSAAMDYRCVPTNTFTLPNISRVGLLEEEAAQHYPNLKIHRGPVADWVSSQRIGERHGFFKVLVDGDRDEIVGAHLTRHHAAEVINVFALALQQRVTTAELAQLPWAYPTFSSDLKRMIG